MSYPFGANDFLPATEAEPLDVIYFAGMGGSAQAYREALGKDPDVALNHSDWAIGVHQVNFPNTEHILADVFDIDPRVIRPGRKWRSFWASPDCRHFSRAKGAAPVSAPVRGLAWIVVKVAKLLGDLAPDVIFVENVVEFRTWGPLIAKPGAFHKDGSPVMVPDPARKGQTFRLWLKRLRQCGYVVEYRDVVDAGFGDPTTRTRFQLIARRDGLPIVWPEPMRAPRKTAAKRGLQPYVPAAEIIDFGIDCPSIFLSQAEADAQGLKVRRPLKDATLRRIARGTQRYVIEAAEPFIVPITHRGGDRVHGVGVEPLRTITGANRGEFALIAPLLVPRYGERPGQEPRCRDIQEPYPAAVSTANGGQLVAAWMEQANTGMTGHDMREPVSALTSRGTQQRLIAAHLDYAYGSNVAAGCGDPRDALKAVTAQGNHHFVVQHALRHPFADHGEELRAFLIKYYGTATAQDLADPLHSATSRARFGLVVVQGIVWRIVDIGMRMLTPDELKAAQGFPRHYITGHDAFGRKVTKTKQIHLIGDTVCVKKAAAHIRANLPRHEPLKAAA